MTANHRPPGNHVLDMLLDKLCVHKETPPATKDSMVRASGFGSTCTRQVVLLSRLNMPVKQINSSDTELNFALGSGIHWAAQNLILPRMDVLRGRWACQACGNTVGGRSQWRGEFGRLGFDTSCLVPRPAACEFCGGSEFSHVEQYLIDEGLRISAHPDAFIAVDGHGIGVLEIKSISGRGALDIRKTVKPEHLIQVHVYMMLTGLPWAIVWYWDKSKFGAAGLTEHVIPRDDRLIHTIYHSLLELKAALAAPDSPLPVRKVCANATCATALACPVVGPCFEDDPKIVRI